MVSEKRFWKVESENGLEGLGFVTVIEYTKCCGRGSSGALLASRSCSFIRGDLACTLHRMGVD